MGLTELEGQQSPIPQAFTGALCNQTIVSQTIVISPVQERELVLKISYIAHETLVLQRRDIRRIGDDHVKTFRRALPLQWLEEISGQEANTIGNVVAHRILTRQLKRIRTDIDRRYLRVP